MTSHMRSRPLSRRVSDLIDSGFPFFRTLAGHTSCVNALAFSNDGRFLVSGGDDLQIRLWDFHQDDLSTSCVSCIGPRSNILAIAISASNRYIYSGGTDNIVLKYDIARCDFASGTPVTYSPSNRYAVHQDTIRGIACHPVLDEVVLSASEDGSIVRHDGRESPLDRSRRRAQNTLQLSTEITDIEYHPYMDHFFVTSDSQGSVYLRDERMAFGPLSHRSQQGVVLQYHTRLCRQSSNFMSNPESSSVAFDSGGTRLAVTFLHYHPTIYSLSDPNPIAFLSGNQLPNGMAVPAVERTYSNSCTMKHGSFGGPALETDDLYVGGSDDFRGYVWKIPPLAELLEEREIISARDWESKSRLGTIGFAQGRHGDKCIPVELSRPLYRLTGHRSIVNTTAVHPYMLHIVTAGIECNIILHSPTPSSPCTQNLARTPVETRVLSDDGELDQFMYHRALRGAPVHGDMHDPDGLNINVFDHILREEGGADVFEVRRWQTDSDESSDEVDQDRDSEDSDVTEYDAQ